MSTYLNGGTAGVGTVQHVITRQFNGTGPVQESSTIPSDNFVNVNSPNNRITVSLSSGDNTYAIPSNAQMVAIFLPAGNAQAVTVRFTGMSTGAPINPVGFYHSSLPTTTPANLIINAGGTVNEVQIWFD